MRFLPANHCLQESLKFKKKMSPRVFIQFICTLCLILFFFVFYTVTCTDLGTLFGYRRDKTKLQ